MERPAPGLDPAELFQSLFDGVGNAFIFESGKGPDATARYTFMGVSNGTHVEINSNEGLLFDAQSGEKKALSAESCLEAIDFDAQVQEVNYFDHFWGGWVGYIGYDACGLFERLPPTKVNDLSLPDAHFMQIDRLIVYDHQQSVLKTITSQLNQYNSNTYDNLLDELHEWWITIENALLNPGRRLEPNTRQDEIRCNQTRAQYMQRVEKAKSYIREGDIYQANLAQRFEADYPGDPFELYRLLKKVNPSPFSGFLQLTDWALVSSSPERLVKVKGPLIESRPIAGTRPRGQDRDSDRSLSRELLLSSKERAEHLMLVDLLRNDLGRLSEIGSVRVTDLMFLENYSHVQHIVSNIKGRLKPGIGVRDILQAVFPGGTITGCPKIRCMEIIHELEPLPRGPYSGSLGYIGFSRRMDLNIIIRTLVVKNGIGYFHTGAGIVADSSPAREYDETLDKAQAMMEALSFCTQPEKNP
jgi:aminodeoxychorismate synthase component I